MANLLGVQMEAGINPAIKLSSQAEAGIGGPSLNVKQDDSSKEMKKENEEQPADCVT